MIRSFLKNNKEISENYLWRALQVLSKQGISFLMIFLTAKYLAPTDYGLFTFITASLSFFLLISDFGLSTATSKFVAQYREERKDHLYQTFSSISMIIIFMSSLISVLIIVFGRYLFKDAYVYALLFIPYIFFIPLSSLLDGIYRGLKQFKRLAILSVSVGIISLFSSYYLISKHHIIGAIISQNLLFFLLSLVLFIFLKEKSNRINSELTKSILKYSVIIGFSNLMYLLYTRADIIILQYFGYLTEIGYYEIINNLFNFVVAPFIIFGQVIAPDSTSLYVKKKYKDLISNFKNSIVVGSVLALVISTGLFFLFPLLLKLLLRNYYTPLTLLMFNLLLLVLPLRIIASIISHGHTVPTENAHISLWTMIPAGVGNVILDIVFITKFGVIGIVYASLICNLFAITSFILIYYLKIKRLSVNDYAQN